MENSHDQQPKLFTSNELIDILFSQILIDPEKYNLEVVGLIRKHLGGNTFHSRAGNLLADELIELAKSRVVGGQK
jgi:hypothetical protein